MAEPAVVKKISELQEMIAALAANDLIVYVDVSELLAADQTKYLQVGNLKLLQSSQITDGIIITSKILDLNVTTAKIADLNVTEGKLAAAVQGKLVTNGNAHDHAGGDGAVIPETGLAAAVQSQLVTNGDSHDHAGGDGNQIAPAGTTFLDHMSAGSQIFAGAINGQGDWLVNPMGWTVVWIQTGQYRFTHNLGHLNYVVVANTLILGNSYNVQLSDWVANSFDLQVLTKEGVLENGMVWFMVVAT